MEKESFTDSIIKNLEEELKDDGDTQTHLAIHKQLLRPQLSLKKQLKSKDPVVPMLPLNTNSSYESAAKSRFKYKDMRLRNLRSMGGTGEQMAVSDDESKKTPFPK